jgi:hypothetical protein
MRPGPNTPTAPAFTSASRIRSPLNVNTPFGYPHRRAVLLSLPIHTPASNCTVLRGTGLLVPMPKHVHTRDTLNSAAATARALGPMTNPGQRLRGGLS